MRWVMTRVFPLPAPAMPFFQQCEAVVVTTPGRVHQIIGGVPVHHDLAGSQPHAALFRRLKQGVNGLRVRSAEHQSGGCSVAQQQVVIKVFKLNYMTSQDMAEFIRPLLSPAGSVTEVRLLPSSQLNSVLPPEQVSSEQIEDVMSMLSEMGINVIEDEEAEEEDAKGGTEIATTESNRDVALSSGTSEKLDRTDDPAKLGVLVAIFAPKK